MRQVRPGPPVLGAVLAMGVLATTSIAAAPAHAAGGCTIWFTGVAGARWENPANWSLTDLGAPAGRIPGVADVACASRSHAADTTIRSSVSVSGLDWGDDRSASTLLLRDGAALDLAAAGESRIGRLNAGRAVIDGPGTLHVDTAVATGTTFDVAVVSLQYATFADTVRLTGAVTSSSTLKATGDLVLGPTAMLQVDGRLLVQPARSGAVAATWAGAGRIDITVNGRVFVEYGAEQSVDVRLPFHNGGQFSAGGGAVTFTRLLDYRNGVLGGGGRWFGSVGEVDLGGPITTLAAGTTLLANGASFRTAITALTTIGGHFAGSGFTTNRPVKVVQGGDAEFGSGVVLPGLDVVDGEARVDGLTVTGVIRIRPGAIGYVTETPVHADVVNGGRLTHWKYGADLPQPDAVDGDYTALPGSETRVLGLDVAGTATLGGRFVRRAADGAGIDDPGTYTLLRAAAVVGTWDGVGIDADGPVRPFYTATGFGVRVLPPAAPGTTSR